MLWSMYSAYTSYGEDVMGPLGSAGIPFLDHHTGITPTSLMP